MTNETKQTAVEWLIEHFQKLQREGEKMSWQQVIDISKLAKEMEKEQMIDFAQEVFRNRYNQITQSLGNIADDIYNETYGGNK